MLVTPALVQSGLGWTEAELVRAKIVLALVCAAAAAVVGLFAPVGPLVVAGAGYAGFIAPTLRVDRAAAYRRSEADRALVALVEWAEALVASGWLRSPNRPTRFGPRTQVCYRINPRLRSQNAWVVSCSSPDACRTAQPQ